jgi:acyl-CoA thioesterase
MGNLATDADLTAGGDGSYSAMLSRDWEIWGPNGGYIAALAMRAAQLETTRARPANATVHFLGAASFETPVIVNASIQRATRQATSVGVRIDQDGKPILSALIWALDDAIDGLAHDDLSAPDVPAWRELPTLAERQAALGIARPSMYRFWDNFEQRPPSWIDDWDNRELSEAKYLNWLRFVEGDAADAWSQAARLMLLVDLGGWPSIGLRHRSESWMAPSIDVSCEFHRPGTGDEWFLLHGASPHASAGLIASHQHVWNDRGELLASGISHMLCRRIA